LGPQESWGQLVFGGIAIPFPLLFLKNFVNDPFETLDELDLSWCGFQFNLLRDDIKLRKAIFEIFFVIPLILWVLLGADSTVEQLTYFIFNFPNVVLQKITVAEWFQIYNSYYGLGTHWSASVIYSLLLIGISKHLREKLDVKNSANLALTTGFVGITIACFEFFWMSSYYLFQNQPWILSLQFPQFRIILQNVMFLAPGIIILLGFNWKEYKLNFNKITVITFLGTIALILFWWFYPFSTPQLTVPIEGYGLWRSSPNFPQTMYTVQPSIKDASGIMYHIDDAGVHLLNNLTKIFMTLTFYNLFKIKSRKGKK